MENYLGDFLMFQFDPHDASHELHGIKISHPERVSADTWDLARHLILTNDFRKIKFMFDDLCAEMKWDEKRLKNAFEGFYKISLSDDDDLSEGYLFGSFFRRHSGETAAEFSYWFPMASIHERLKSEFENARLRACISTVFDGEQVVF